MTNFNWLLDGSIVGLYLLVTMVAGLMVRKYVGKVEHFLVAGREMDVYLGIASLAATEFGIVTCMYTAQNGFEKGFAGATPGILMAAAMLVVGLTGFVIKPLRDSGVITIPELFEKRFGQRVRWAAGVVIVLGGLLNMGVFLRTGGQFLVLVAGLDVRYLEIMMTALLIAVTILILMNVGWEKMVSTVETRYGAGGFNPFVNPTMGWQYVVFNAMLNTAAVLTWQTIIARVLSAKDTETGRKVYTRTSFFFVCRFLIPGIWGIAALATLGPVANTLEAMPQYLSTAVPAGLMGILVAAMLAADMSTDSSYMLTWCSVIYNDILAPFRKRPWSERKGLFWNRTIIALIGIFLLLYGLWYPLKGDLWTYLGVTGTIYLASISVLLIACCYWRRANNWGAGASIVVSAVIPVTYLVMEQVTSTAALAKSIGPYYSGIATYVLSGAAMILGSMLKPQSRLEGRPAN